MGYMDILKYSAPKRTFNTKFKWNGLNAEESLLKKQVGKFEEFWGLRDSYLSYVNQLYNAASEEAFDTFSDSRQNAQWSDTSSVAGRGIATNINEWEALDNIISGKMSGNIVAYDTETLGDFSGKNDEMKMVTEFGISKHTYEKGIRKNYGIDNLSLAFGIHESQVQTYQTVVDKVRSGMPLTQEEDIVAKRFAVYSGKFSDRFAKATEAQMGFLKSIGFKDQDVMVATGLATHVSSKDPDVVASGFENLIELGKRSNLIDQKGKSIFSDAVNFISDSIADPYSVLAVYNGGFDSRAINEVSRVFKIQSATMLPSSTGNVDLMHGVRAASANRRESVAEYIQKVAKANGGSVIKDMGTGGQLEDVVKAVGLTGDFHNAGSDANNTALLAGMFNFYTEDMKHPNGSIVTKPNSIAQEAIRAYDEYKNGKSFSVGETVYFKSDANMDINRGEFATVNGDPISTVSTTGRFWSIENVKRVASKDTNGEEAFRYFVEYKNAAFEDNPETDTRIYKVFDTEDDLQKFALSKTILANEITGKEINAQQRLMDMDQGRREFDKLWSITDVASNNYGDSVGGFHNLKKMSEFHKSFMAKVGELQDSAELIKTMDVDMIGLTSDIDPEQIALYKEKLFKPFLKEINKGKKKVFDSYNTIMDKKGIEAHLTQKDLDQAKELFVKSVKDVYKEIDIDTIMKMSNRTPNKNNIIYGGFDPVIEKVRQSLGTLSKYEARNYKYMFSKFETTGDVIDSIIGRVNAYDGLNNMQQTRMASSIRDTLLGLLTPGNKIGNGTTIVSNISKDNVGIQALNDIRYMKVLDPSGSIRRINVSDITAATNEIMDIFSKKGEKRKDSSRESIINIIDGMRTVANDPKMPEQFRDQIIETVNNATDYITGNNEVTKYTIASMFSSKLNKVFDVSDIMQNSVSRYTDYTRFIDDIQKIDPDRSFKDVLSEFSLMTNDQRREFLKKNELNYETEINPMVAEMVYAKNFIEGQSIGEKDAQYKDGIVRYINSKGNEKEETLNEMAKRSWWKNVEDEMDKTAKSVAKEESSIIFSNGVGDINEVSQRVAKGLNYDKLTDKEYEQAVKSIKDILTHVNKDDPTRSYGILNIEGYQTAIFQPKNSINGEAFFVTTPKENFSRIYETMRSIEEGNKQLSGKQIETILNEQKAGVLTFKKINVRQLEEGMFTTSINVGTKGQERFLPKALDGYISGFGKNAGELVAEIKSGPIQLIQGYRKIGATDYIPKLLNGQYAEATKSHNRSIDAIITKDPGTVGQQTIMFDEKIYKGIMPNLSDMNSAGMVSMEKITDFIPEMVQMDPENRTLQTLLSPFIPEDRFDKDKTLTPESARAAVESLEFKEMFYKHISTPVKNDYIFTSNGYKQSYIEEVFGKKNILEVIRDVVLGKNDSKYHHEGNSLPMALDTIIKNNLKFEALKEKQVEKWMIDTINPLLYNDGSMFDAYQRPTNMQQLTLRYFNQFSEGNEYLNRSEQIARVGNILESKQLFEQNSLRYGFTTKPNEAEINQLYSERKITGFIRQTDDLGVAKSIIDFEAAGADIKERIFNRLSKGKSKKESNRILKQISTLDESTLSNMYDIMKREMNTVYEGAFLIRPSIGNSEIFRTPDIRNIEIPEFTENENIKAQILDRLMTDSNVYRGDILAVDGNKSYKWEFDNATILNAEEFMETGIASVLPFQRAIGDVKLLAGNEKAMGHTIGYNFHDKNSIVAKMFPELSKKVIAGDITFNEAKNIVDQYTDPIMSAIFGEKAAMVGQMGVNKHFSGSAIFESKLNVILGEASKELNPQKMESMISDLNRAGFKDWNFKVSYDMNPNYKTPKPIFTYDISNLVETGDKKGYMAEIMNLERMVRSGEIGDKNYQKNVVKLLDEMEENNYSLIGIGRALNQEKKGEAVKLNSRYKNVIRMLDDYAKTPIPGYNAFDDGKLYVDKIMEEIDSIIYGNDSPTEKQLIKRKELKENLSVLRAMDTSLEYMEHAKDIATAQNVVSAHFDELNIPKSGASREELALSIFGINGKPSDAIRKLAGTKNVDNINVLKMKLPKGLFVTMNKNELSEVLIPMQNIQVSNRENKGFYTKSQIKVVGFLNSIKQYEEGLDQGAGISKLRNKVQKSFESMYSAIQEDLGTNSDSMYSNLIERQALPNSAQFQAQKIESPIPVEMTLGRDEWDGRSFTEEYKRLMYDGITDDMPFEKKQAKMVSNKVKAEALREKVTKEYADRIRSGEVLELVGGENSVTTIERIVDGKKVKMKVYDNVTSISERGMNKLGVDKMGIGTFLYKDMGADGALNNAVSKGWKKETGKDAIMDRFIEAFNKQNENQLTTETANKYILDNTMFEFSVGEKTYRTDFEDVLEKIALKNDQIQIVDGVNIADLNNALKSENLKSVVIEQMKEKQINAQKIEDAFSFLRNKYLEEVGIAAIDDRHPLFYAGSILIPLLKLDPKLTTDENVNSTAYGALIQNLDLDGDNKDLAILFNGVNSLINKNNKQVQATWGLHENLNLNMKTALADIIEKYKVVDDVTNPALYMMDLIKTFDEDLYDLMEQSGFEENSVLEGIVQFSETQGNMLTNQKVKQVATKAKSVKPGIGSISIPNFKLRTIMEDFVNDIMPEKDWQRIKKDLTSFSEEKGVSGILTFTEQKGIDVKHDTFSEYISDTPLWTSGMNSLFKKSRSVSVESEKLRTKNSMMQLLRAAGPKLKNDANYIKEKKHIEDAERILSTTWEEFQGQLEAEKRKASELAELISKGDLTAKAQLKEVNDEIKNIEVLSSFRSVYDLSEYDAAKMMYQANMVGGAKSFSAAKNQRNVIKKIRKEYPELINNGSSADANAIRSIKAELMNSIKLDPFEDVMIDRQKGEGFIFSKYSKDGSEAIFNKIDLKATINQKKVRKVNNTKRIKISENPETAMRDAFLDTKLSVSSLIRFRMEDEVNGPARAIDRAAKELVVEELTEGIHNPFGTVGSSDTTNYKRMLSYDSNIEELLKDPNLTPRKYSTANQINKKKYRIMTNIQELIPGIEGIEGVNGYISVGKALYSHETDDGKSLLRSINRGIIQKYSENSLEDVPDAILNELKNNVAGGNDLRHEKISRISSQISAGFNDSKAAIEYFHNLENLRNDLYDINEISRKNVPQEKVSEYQLMNQLKIAEKDERIYDIINRSNADVDIIYNLNDADLSKRRVGFGIYTGYEFGDLSTKDIDNLTKEIELTGKILRPNDKRNHAIQIAKETLGSYNRENVSKLKDTVSVINVGNVIPEELIDADTVEKIIESASGSTSTAGKIAQDAARNVGEVIDATERMAHKTAKLSDSLTGKIKSGAKTIGSIGGSAISLGMMAMFAIGVVNNIIHKDDQKSPLVPEESGNAGAVGQQVNPHKIKPSTGGKVLYTDSNSGLTFKVNAKTADYIMQGNTAPFKQPGSKLQINTEEDTSSVNSHWLKEKMADIF